MMIDRGVLWVAALWVGASVATPAAFGRGDGPCPYLLTEAGSGPALDRWSCGYGEGELPSILPISVNGHGTWAGLHRPCYAAWQAVAWTPEGGMQPLPVPAGTYSTWAMGLNDVGTFVGVSNTWNSGTHDNAWWGVIWTNGRLIEIPPLEGETTWSVARAVNNAGLVIGYSTTPQGFLDSPQGPCHPFIWNNGAVVYLDLTPFGFPNANAIAVSDSGAVVGLAWSGTTKTSYRYQDGRIELLQPHAGGAYTIVTGVNAAGDAAGKSTDSTGITAVPCVWPAGNSTPRTLELPLGATGGKCLGISNDGTVLGQVGIAGQATLVVWIDGHVHALAPLITPSPSYLGVFRAFGPEGHIAFNYGPVTSDSVGARVLFPTASVADLNHDCAVDAADLGTLLAAWGTKGDSPADLDGSGLVDGGDLGVLLGSWSEL